MCVSSPPRFAASVFLVFCEAGPPHRARPPLRHKRRHAHTTLAASQALSSSITTAHTHTRSPDPAPHGRRRPRPAARPAARRVHRGRCQVLGRCEEREGEEEEERGVCLLASLPPETNDHTPTPPRLPPPSLSSGRTADDAIRELNAAHAAYRRVEASLGAQRARLLAKKPDIDKALAAVELLRERREKGDEVREGEGGGG